MSWLIVVASIAPATPPQLIAASRPPTTPASTSTVRIRNTTRIACIMLPPRLDMAAQGRVHAQVGIPQIETQAVKDLVAY